MAESAPSLPRSASGTVPLGRPHPGRWRGWLDFGNGALGDMAPHLMDSAFWALNLTGDCAVTIECEGVNEQTYPTWSIVTWHFPARPGIKGGKEIELPPVKVNWYEGGKKPKKPDNVSEKEWKKFSGAAVFGPAPCSSWPRRRHTTRTWSRATSPRSHAGHGT